MSNSRTTTVILTFSSKFVYIFSLNSVKSQKWEKMLKILVNEVLFPKWKVKLHYGIPCKFGVAYGYSMYRKMAYAYLYTVHNIG